MGKEKKEIWMRKLMKYVEEIQKEWINICRPTFQEYYLLEMMLISKYYWLIKRLVENDKIDFNKLEKIWYIGTVYRYDWQYRDIIEYSNYERLLMLLSIQDEPIDFLISILK